jgi:hypothetical protein
MKDIRGDLRAKAKQSKPAWHSMLEIARRLSELIVPRLVNATQNLPSFGNYGYEADKETRPNRNSLRDDPIIHVRKEMEIITADGRRAGHVSQCDGGQIYMVQSNRPIPKEWIRRVDRQDVYISKRLSELAQLEATER